MRLLLIALVFATPWTVTAQGMEDSERRGMRGLEGVRLLVEKLDPAAAQIGITEAGLRAEVEAHLRKGEVPVLSQEQFDRTKAKPYLYVSLNIVCDAKTCVHGVNLRLIQSAAVTNGASLMAGTWQRGSIGVNKRAETREKILFAIERRLEAFIATFQAENRQPKKTPR